MLHELGQKIDLAVSQTTDHWNKLQKINANEVRMLQLYSAFLTEVINDESGKELEDKAKNIECQNINKMLGEEEDELLEGYLI